MPAPTMENTEPGGATVMGPRVVFATFKIVNGAKTSLPSNTEAGLSRNEPSASPFRERVSIVFKVCEGAPMLADRVLVHGPGPGGAQVILKKVHDTFAAMRAQLPSF